MIYSRGSNYLGTAVSLLFLIIGLSFGEESASRFENIAHDLINGKRTIMAIGKLATRFLLLVGGAGDGQNLDDTFVYDLPLNAFDSDTLRLYPSNCSRLQDKWPALYKATNGDNLLQGLMFAVQMDARESLLVIGGEYIGLLDLATGKMEQLTGVAGWPKSGHHESNASLGAVSSSGQRTFFVVSSSGSSIHRMMLQVEPHSHITETQQYHICKSHQELVVTISLTACPLAGTVDWDIRSGFMDSHSAYFFLTSKRTIIELAKAAFFYSISPGSPIKVRNIHVKDFFVVTSDQNTSRAGLIAGIVILSIALVALCTGFGCWYLWLHYKSIVERKNEASKEPRSQAMSRQFCSKQTTPNSKLLVMASKNKKLRPSSSARVSSGKIASLTKRRSILRASSPGGSAVRQGSSRAKSSTRDSHHHRKRKSSKRRKRSKS